MSEKKTPKYVQTERNAKGRLVAKGTLRRGLKIGENVFKKFSMQEALIGDFIEAEKDASVEHSLGYNAAVIARMLVSMDDYEGPFTMAMMKSLPIKDYNILREAQQEIETLGEDD